MLGELLLCGRDLRGGVGVFFREAFHAAGGVNQLLLASEEWMAIGADFHVQLFTLDGRTGGEIVAAGAVENILSKCFRCCWSYEDPRISPLTS